jgi:hypothetical protein
MTLHRKMIAAAFVFLAMAALPARFAAAEYPYMHSEGEYSITLPDAPRAATIWADQTDPAIPFLDKPPPYGSVGETTTLRRIDNERGDLFDIQTIFLKAGKDFVQKQTQESLTKLLENYMASTPLDKKQTSYSGGTSTLKWATLTGYQIDEKNNLFFVGSHLLTGTDTLFFVRIKYSAENKDFGAHYKKIIASIKYVGH